MPLPPTNELALEWDLWCVSGAYGPALGTYGLLIDGTLLTLVLIELDGWRLWWTGADCDWPMRGNGCKLVGGGGAAAAAAEDCNWGE